jgi:hypothetical protein
MMIESARGSGRVIGALSMTRSKVVFFAIAFCLMVPGSSLAQTAKPVAPPLPPQTSTEIPEPGDFALFVIGIAGLVIGRWSSRSRKRRREEV